MNNIPDFVLNFQEIQHNLEVVVQQTAQVWSDQTQKRYFTQYLDKYTESINNYITGLADVNIGLDQILRAISDALDKMEIMTGKPSSVAFEDAAGESYYGGFKDSNGNENSSKGDSFYNDGPIRPWDRSYNGVKPGELDNEDIIELMK